MNDNWQKFLLSINASIENNTVTHFSHSREEEQSAFSNVVLADLSHYALIKASGDELLDFLQGQLTNDIKLVTEQMGQLSAYCNPKGRILANFRIFKRDNDYFLRLHSSICEATLKRLRMFIMRSKVELTDSSNELSRMGIAGWNAEKALSSLFNNLPKKADESCNENEITLVRLAGNMPRFEAYGSFENIKNLWEKLQDDAIAIGENSWNLLTVRAAIPEIVSETVEAFVPQMVNLQAINSLSFTKGCYTGQEVVARMHYLGKLKRRLFVCSVESEDLPLAGQAIMTNNQNEQKVGQVVTASWSKDKKIEFLAVLQIEKAETETLHIGTSTGPTIQFIDLPYSLVEEEKK